MLVEQGRGHVPGGGSSEPVLDIVCKVRLEGDLSWGLGGHGGGSELRSSRRGRRGGGGSWEKHAPMGSWPGMTQGEVVVLK